VAETLASTTTTRNNQHLAQRDEIAETSHSSESPTTAERAPVPRPKEKSTAQTRLGRLNQPQHSANQAVH